MLRRVGVLCILICIFSMVFSSNFVYANEVVDQDLSNLGQYLKSQQINITNSVNSDGYIKYLMENDVDFEIIDSYYEKINTEDIEKNEGQGILYLNGNAYMKSHVSNTRNSIPKSLNNKNGDFRVREVKSSYYNIQVDFKNGLYQNLAKQSISIIGGLAGKSHPLVGFIMAAASQIPYSESEYGWMNTTIKNNYVYSDVWHEVYDNRDFTAMVITESRKTNIIFYEDVTNKNTGSVKSALKNYNNIYYQYSKYFGQLTRNTQEALNRYRAGITFPNVYRYNTGTSIDNTHLLPKR